MYIFTTSHRIQPQPYLNWTSSLPGAQERQWWCRWDGHRITPSIDAMWRFPLLKIPRVKNAIDGWENMGKYENMGFSWRFSMFFPIFSQPSLRTRNSPSYDPSPKSSALRAADIIGPAAAAAAGRSCGIMCSGMIYSLQCGAPQICLLLGL